MLTQTPNPGSHIVVHSGDTIEIRLETRDHGPGTAWLRSNLRGANIHRTEIVDHTESGSPRLERDWFDTRMQTDRAGLSFIRIPLHEPGYFQAKTFFLTEDRDEPIWPQGDNIFIKVEPAVSKNGNSLYSAFVRLFGDRQHGPSDQNLKDTIDVLDSDGYSVIPRSGKFRDLIKELDSIVDRMGFRNLLLLPIHPTPTTYARMGRFGSPFAALDLMDIDPALAEFDRKTTPLDQFRELIDATHAREACLFMDMPLNHTGWASALQIHHPTWFTRGRQKEFQSPGAWGVTWEDLAELNYEERDLWMYMANVFLYWCRMGVDGFRCDAGYMVPARVWEYITAKVRLQFPDTIFLLEGLGGKKTATRTLLTSSNLNWAYSELFQNYDRSQIEPYVKEANDTSEHFGLLVTFAETHDNNRLAATSRNFAAMRTSLCALLSQQGAFGITCGAEWFASEKIDVHERTDMNWGAEDNQVDLISRLNTILISHPAFAFGSKTEILYCGNANAILVKRTSENSTSFALVAANLDTTTSASLEWQAQPGIRDETIKDLLSDRIVRPSINGTARKLALQPGEVLCLTNPRYEMSTPDKYEQAALAKAVQVACTRYADIEWNDETPSKLAAMMRNDPVTFTKRFAPENNKCSVVIWRWPEDACRRVPVPVNSHIVIISPHPFSVDLIREGTTLSRDKGLPSGEEWFTILTRTGDLEGNAQLIMSVYKDGETMKHKSELCLLGTVDKQTTVSLTRRPHEVRELTSSALCTNQKGAMSLVNGAWGEITSQYDCLLAGNLHPSLPSDRHIMLTRCRAWLVLRGYSQQIDISNLERFLSQPPNRAMWEFSVPTGMGKRIYLRLSLTLAEDSNRVQLLMERADNLYMADLLAPETEVKIILRFDIEDRSFHAKTKAFAGPEQSWPAQITTSEHGFTFEPAPDRTLSVNAEKGTFTREEEWSYMVAHPFDSERGLDGSSDLFSPGFFTITLKGGEQSSVSAAINAAPIHEQKKIGPASEQAKLDEHVQRALSQFIVKRGEQHTVIAGYPWFLDWGRDTLIFLRGMIACNMFDEARDIIRQFASFEESGTIPNMIAESDVSNRDTSDAPLWLHIAASDLIEAEGSNCLNMDCAGRSLADVLTSIGQNYLSGTPNGIKVDPDTGLVFSPSHFTWMDTNHPAGTPREGYPIEIQALWYNCVALLSRIAGDKSWKLLRKQVGESVERLYFRESIGYLSDCLHCGPGISAANATPDDHLRPNQLMAVTLDTIASQPIREAIISACQSLLVPGAIRSLADRPVTYDLPVLRGNTCLNNPKEPYWPHYSGDEDTRRKPAYHNGTAWTWPLPAYCEALIKTYGTPAAKTARSYLSGALRIMYPKCIGQIPELLDGDAPHKEKGCTAQAWGVSEFARLLVLIDKME